MVVPQNKSVPQIKPNAPKQLNVPNAMLFVDERLNNILYSTPILMGHPLIPKKVSTAS
jgi:hypothetical protein